MKKETTGNEEWNLQLRDRGQPPGHRFSLVLSKTTAQTGPKKMEPTTKQVWVRQPDAGIGGEDLRPAEILSLGPVRAARRHAGWEHPCPALDGYVIVRSIRSTTAACDAVQIRGG